MILGIGTDLANIERIEKTLARFGDRFRNRVFTEREQRKAEGRPRAVAATYAKRWPVGVTMVVPDYCTFTSLPLLLKKAETPPFDLRK